jgi:hypothetical protein
VTVVPAEAIKAPGERRWETIQIAREKVEKRVRTTKVCWIGWIVA